jgi:ElaA protein
MNIVVKKFEDLTVQELYDIMVLRQEVFVVEQDCPYLDADGRDTLGWHAMLIDGPDDQIMAYTRLLGPGVSYEKYSSIGRVVSSQKGRGKGYGKAIMDESVSKLISLYPDHSIKISAQSYLLKFYTEFGFVKTGEEYLEDGIPHMGMIRE